MSWFPTTCWTMVIAAGTGTPRGRAALHALLTRYHASILRYIRYLGLSRPDAEDVGQELYLSLLDGDRLRHPLEERVSFGGYLRRAIDHQVQDWRRHASRQKRGGGAVHESLDEHDHQAALTRESFFEELCAHESFDMALETVRNNWARREQSPERWRTLVANLAGDIDDEAAGAVLGVRPASIRTLRKRLHDDLDVALGQLAADVAKPGDEGEHAAMWLRLVGRG